MTFQTANSFQQIQRVKQGIFIELIDYFSVVREKDIIVFVALIIITTFSAFLLESI